MCRSAPSQMEPPCAATCVQMTGACSRPIWGSAFRCAVARSAGALWLLHRLLEVAFVRRCRAGIWHQLMNALTANDTANSCELRRRDTSRIPTMGVWFHETEKLREEKRGDGVGGTPWSIRPSRGRISPAAAFSNRRWSVRSLPLPRHTSKTAYAAGSLALGVWDHWVPGANKTFAALCDEWGTKNNVEVKIDFITSQGEKDKLTAAAEAQAGTGHDIMSHRDWNIRIHAEQLDPLDDVVRRADQAIRADQPGGRISCQDQRHVARRADHVGQPGKAMLLALRPLSGACRNRLARDVPGRRIEMG